MGETFHVYTNNHYTTNSFIAHKIAVFSSVNNLYFLVIGVNYVTFNVLTTLDQNLVTGAL